MGSEEGASRQAWIIYLLSLGIFNIDFLNHESFELIKYGRNSIIVRDHPSFDETIEINGVRYTCPAELSEQLVELDPRQVYGYDYVNDEQSIEIISDDPDWMLEELFDVDEVVRMIGEGDIYEEDYDDEDDTEDSFNDETTDEDTDQDLIDIGDVDETVFKDPIKMLEYLERLERREAK